MSEKLSDCYECGEVNSLKRVPSSFRLINKQTENMNNASVGEIVKEHIQDAKESIRQQKEEMMKEYEP